MGEETWVVAEEFDAAAHKKLGKILSQSGFQIDKKWDALAGSQDIKYWEVSSSEGSLIIESETYIGLSVSGQSSLIKKIKKAYFSKGD